MSGAGWYLLAYGGQLGPVSPPTISSAVGVSAANNLTVTSRNCVVIDVEQTQARYAFPEGVGTGYTWSLIVGGVAAVGPASQTTSYSPPVVTAVILSGAPAGADDVPTAGGVTVVLMGTCLGADPRLLTVFWNGAVVSGSAIVARHRMVSFPSPSGTGRRVSLRVTVGDQSTATWTPLRYANPVVDGITLRSLPPNEPVYAVSGAEIATGDAVMDGGAVSGEGLPTSGGVAVIVLAGHNFGGDVDVVSVVVGNTPCTLTLHSQSRIECATPLCYGTVTVTVDGVASMNGTASEYEYLSLASPPAVHDVVPLTGPLAGGTVVVLTGSGFHGTASVFFNALDASGRPTGAQAECVWRGVPGMACTETSVQ